jgi:hypothetical protein
MTSNDQKHISPDDEILTMTVEEIDVDYVFGL